MSFKIIDKGGNKKGILQRKILTHQNNAQRPLVSHTPTKPSPQLSDQREFPSLNESAERKSCDLQYASRLLKYSDKVRAQPSSQSGTFISGTLHLGDGIVTKTHNQPEDKAPPGKKAWKSNTGSNDGNANFSNSSYNNTQNKKESAEQKSLQSFKRRTPDKTAASNSSKDSNPSSQPSKSAKSTSESSSPLKPPVEDQQEGSKAKKKKRKSKVKRQVEFQTGKITVLPPEVHLRILNQKSTLSSQNICRVLTDINDEEEYPELRKAVMPASQKENILQSNIPPDCQKEMINKPADTSEGSIQNACEESTNIVPVGKGVEKKAKSDNKEKVHTHNPITISFYEMLLEKNKIKDKEPKDEIVAANHVGMAKIKKNLGPHNLLDSSSPAIKRGKEREKPKPKKPSQLKKVILMDRKARKEHLLQMKNSCEEKNNTNDREFVDEEDTSKDCEACIENSNPLDEKSFSNSYATEENIVETPSLQSENTDLDPQSELISEMEHLNFSETLDINDLSSISNEDTEAENFTVNPVVDLSDEISESDRNIDILSEVAQSVSSTEIHLNVSKSPESLLSNLIGNVRTEMPDKERAAKILLHTRHFREYCNHLISKDIDDAVFALLEDLARFQDRLHQKDPVKARMKRRLIYGVKEVKKHIKLRKLKCIIIAVDLENVESQGGLNDVLNDMKAMAAEHHIPCIFALSRKILGKVCRKPVPVSCVGVFNYEGSEVNFRKIVELQTQSKIDYNEIYNKLVLKLTDEEAQTLLRAKKEAPETLQAIREDILNDFFLEPKIEKDENTHLQSSAE